MKYLTTITFILVFSFIYTQEKNKLDIEPMYISIGFNYIHNSNFGFGASGLLSPGFMISSEKCFNDGLFNIESLSAKIFYRKMIIKNILDIDFGYKYGLSWHTNDYIDNSCNRTLHLHGLYINPMIGYKRIRIGFENMTGIMRKNLFTDIKLN